MPTTRTYSITHKGKEHAVSLTRHDGRACEVSIDGGAPLKFEVNALAPGLALILAGQQVVEMDYRAQGGKMALTLQNQEHVLEVEDLARKRLAQAMGGAAGPGEKNVNANMPGKILKLLVKEGDKVKPGDGLLIMEAMKMENEIKSSLEAKVLKIHVAEGVAVETGAKMIELGDA